MHYARVILNLDKWTHLQIMVEPQRTNDGDRKPKEQSEDWNLTDVESIQHRRQYYGDSMAQHYR